MPIGPVTNLPQAFLRPDVLLLVGEDPTECGAVLGITWAHHYRGFLAGHHGERLVMVTPFGSTTMEALLWELLAPGKVRRIILSGTAGALGGYTGRHMEALQVTDAVSVYQAFDGPPTGYGPSWSLDLPAVSSISTDRFYGFSPLTEGDYPAEPGLCDAWSRWGKTDRIVEMEVAAFFHFAQRFGQPDLQYAAVKVIANDVKALDTLTSGSAEAMKVAIDAALASF